MEIHLSNQKQFSDKKQTVDAVKNTYINKGMALDKRAVKCRKERLPYFVNIYTHPASLFDSFQDRKLRNLPALNMTAGQQHSFTPIRPQSLNTVACHISQCVLSDLYVVANYMVVDFPKMRSGLWIEKWSLDHDIKNGYLPQINT